MTACDEGWYSNYSYMWWLIKNTTHYSGSYDVRKSSELLKKNPTENKMVIMPAIICIYIIMTANEHKYST